MPRPKSTLPKHCLHKASGRGYVTLDGKNCYTGPWGSPAAQAKYHRLLSDWLSRDQGQQEPTAPPEAPLIIAEVVAAFWQHAQAYYRRPDGKPSTELQAYHYALKPLVSLYADLPAVEFGPLRLQAVRREMIKLGWNRRNINQQIGRLKRVFRWAAANELIPGAVRVDLDSVPGLQPGRGGREGKPVRPVAVEHVEATLDHVSRQVAAMVRLQLLTGARSGEICIMRAVDIDRSGEVWHYTPSTHKTAHHGHTRVIPIGPRAQRILEPFLSAKTDLTAYLFSPADAEAERKAKLREARKTPLTPSQIERERLARRRKHRRPPADRYTPHSYARAITRGCEKAFGLPRELVTPAMGETPIQKADRLEKLKAWREAHLWHPHQLRHTAATLARRDYGIEMAKILLGHQSANVTAIYAEADMRKLDEMVKKMG